jgi:hypothetical protein
MALGRILREARERRQLTLSQVAAGTRMKVQVVQALEAEDYRRIPASIYGRGFIRMYAEFVGLDPKLLVAEYMTAISGPVGKPASPSQAPAHGQPPKTPAPTHATPPRPLLTKMTPVVREPVNPKPSPALAPEPPPATVPEPEPPPEPPSPPISAPPPPPAPEPVAVTEPVAQLEPEPMPAPPSVKGTPPITAPRQEHDLFAWSQTVNTLAKASAERTPPPASTEAESSRPGVEPMQTAAPIEFAPYPSQDDVAPVAFTPAAEVGEEPELPAQTEPAPVFPFSPLPQEKTPDNLFDTAVLPPLARPPKTTLEPQPPAYMRRLPQNTEPEQERGLSSERAALRMRIIYVSIGVIVVTILLISAISNCSAPAKEMKRGPVKERLKMAVEPPAPYID